MSKVSRIAQVKGPNLIIKFACRQKSELKRESRTAGDSGRLADTDIGGVSRLETYHGTTKP